MQKEHGIKETMELLKGIDALIVLFIKQFKDGFQVEDLAQILAAMAINPEFKDALAGIKKLPEEVKDIDLEEGLELGMFLLKNVPKYIEAAK